LKWKEFQFLSHGNPLAQAPEMNVVENNSAVQILIVEDDEEMRSLLKEFLEEEGFETECASNGTDALREIAKKPFDLIVTDIEMPGLTGLDIIPEMNKLRPEVSIIVMTSFANEEVHRRSLEKGAGGYLEKPIHIEKLKALIHEMLSAKQGMSSPRASPNSR
jgi:DNA-binding response OmpR family regulator